MKYLILCLLFLNPHLDEHILPQLKNGESISILFTSSGCFNFIKKELVITKQLAEYNATLFLYTKEIDKNLKNTNRKLIDTTTLDKSERIAFETFIKEIKLAKGSGCTTIDEYNITSPVFNIVVKDGGCNWNGFQQLETRLFKASRPK